MLDQTISPSKISRDVSNPDETPLLDQDSSQMKINNSERATDPAFHSDSHSLIHCQESFKQSSMKHDHFDHAEEIKEVDNESFFQDEPRKKNNRIKNKMAWGLIKMHRFATKAVQQETPWKEMNFIQKIIYVLVDAPFTVLRRLTIPPVNEETWDRRFAVISPVFSVTMFFLVSEMIDFSGPPPIAYYCLIGASLVLSIVIYYTTKQQHAPKRFIIVYALGGFFMSIIWILFVANVLIDILSLLGVIFSLKPAFLGITVLAWGNSVGDMIANLAISKKGYAKMAVTGCIAGPLFNLFFGLGISLGKEAIVGNISDFSIHNTKSVLPLACGGLLFANLLFLSLSSILTRFVLSKWIAVIQVLFFICGMVGLSILAFTVD